MNISKRCSYLFFQLLLVTSSTTLLYAQESAKLPSCFREREVPIYHAIHDRCLRDGPNSVRWKHTRQRRYQQLLEDGVYYIPDERTVRCPKVTEDWEIGQVGHDTRIIFENDASTPVVLIYVERGIEYSAVNRRKTPPYRDSQAILQPGEWTVVDALEGHVFYARELKENYEMGRILVQHQAGLVPIKNRYGHQLDCQEPNLPDVLDLAQLSVDEQEELVKKVYQEIDREPSQADVEESRTHSLRAVSKGQDISKSLFYTHCNLIQKGFRNTLTGCPVNIFNSGNQQPVDGPMICQEEFKTHLGISPCAENYMGSWESRMKFETTYVGETWVARLQSNPDIVLDTYTVQPVYIRDCPSIIQDLNVTETIGSQMDDNYPTHYNQQGLNNLLPANFKSYA